MGAKKFTVTQAASLVKSLAEDKNVRRIVFGTYSDGSTRSLSDAINGEILSPKDKVKYKKKKKKSKKKKKVRIDL